ncbi:hypothetical protein CEXT_167021 [Caerostris extrusa]|uniref:Secreted protein n=1 Tax=Caerostris extrusa TaxID=172846 RepID=A0AAV4T4U4_CAEEX|nr:hypothetical protein CEXT_167021 [Caerostris extrusa]
MLIVLSASASLVFLPIDIAFNEVAASLMTLRLLLRTLTSLMIHRHSSIKYSLLMAVFIAYFDDRHAFKVVTVGIDQMYHVNLLIDLVMDASQTCLDANQSCQ